MPNINKNLLGPIIIVIVVAVVVTLFVATLPPPVTKFYSYSFDTDMEDWGPNAIDIDHGNSTLNWSVEQSDEIVKDGNMSVKLYLDNMNDKGKIWMERLFNVTPNQAYKVTIEYDFASADFGTMNLWRIISGVLTERPDSPDDLDSIYQDYTDNKHDSDVGHVWLDKKYEM